MSSASGRPNAPHVRGKPSTAVSQAPDGKPYGRPVPPWSEGLSSQNIVGESFHEAAFKSLASEHGHRSVPEYGVEITEARAAIVRDLDNPYDSDVVAVLIDGRHLVGHLPRKVAAQYTHGLESLDRGRYLQVPARVWIGHRTDWDERSGAEVTSLRGSVTVHLPDSIGIVPYNDLPDAPHTVLPWGRAAQITGEEHHMDVLRTFALGVGPRHVAATLHLIEEPRRTGGPVPVIEVRLDGQRVGVMSKAISDQIHDLVTYVADNGRIPVARAIVKARTCAQKSPSTWPGQARSPRSGSTRSRVTDLSRQQVPSTTLRGVLSPRLGSKLNISTKTRTEQSVASRSGSVPLLIGDAAKLCVSEKPSRPPCRYLQELPSASCGGCCWCSRLYAPSYSCDGQAVPPKQQSQTRLIRTRLRVVPRLRQKRSASFARSAPRRPGFVPESRPKPRSWRLKPPRQRGR